MQRRHPGHACAMPISWSPRVPSVKLADPDSENRHAHYQADQYNARGSTGAMRFQAEDSCCTTYMQVGTKELVEIGSSAPNARRTQFSEDWEIGRRSEQQLPAHFGWWGAPVGRGADGLPTADSQKSPDEHPIAEIARLAAHSVRHACTVNRLAPPPARVGEFNDGPSLL
jgi:hypothetical protein